MLPSLLLGSLWSSAFAQTTDQSFLGDSLVRENQVQNVLEHQLAKDAECRHIVRHRHVFFVIRLQKFMYLHIAVWAD